MHELDCYSVSGVGVKMRVFTHIVSAYNWAKLPQLTCYFRFSLGYLRQLVSLPFWWWESSLKRGPGALSYYLLRDFECFHNCHFHTYTRTYGIIVSILYSHFPLNRFHADEWKICRCRHTSRFFVQRIVLNHAGSTKYPQVQISLNSRTACTKSIVLYPTVQMCCVIKY